MPEPRATVEVEMKFPTDDLSTVRSRLVSLGATLVGNYHQQDDYFSHPCRDLAATDEAFRIRSTDAVQILTYKGPKAEGHAKIREEIEVSMLGFDESTRLRTILLRLGFAPVAVVSKRRQSHRVYRNGRELRIELDEVERLGTFVEIEALTERSHVPAAEQAVMELARDLDLSHPVHSSYLALLLALVKQ